MSSQSSKVEVWTYYGASTDDLERHVQSLIDRGGVVLHLAIGYGPSPAKAAGLVTAHAGTWHAMVVADVSGVDPEL